MDILKKQFEDLNFTEPTLDDCILHCMKKNSETDEESFLIYTTMNYLLELKMKKEQPEKEYKFNDSCFNYTIFAGGLLLFLCVCGLISAVSLYHYIFYAILMVLLLIRSVLLFFKFKDLTDFRELKDIVENRNKK
jgi:hypothetical protein